MSAKEIAKRCVIICSLSGGIMLMVAAFGLEENGNYVMAALFLLCGIGNVANAVNWIYKP